MDFFNQVKHVKLQGWYFFSCGDVTSSWRECIYLEGIVMGYVFTFQFKGLMRGVSLGETQRSRKFWSGDISTFCDETCSKMKRFIHLISRQNDSYELCVLYTVDCTM